MTLSLLKSLITYVNKRAVNLRGQTSPPAVKGLVWYTDGFRMREGISAEV